MILYTGVMLNKFILMELNFDMEKTKPKKRWIIVVAGVIIRTRIILSKKRTYRFYSK